MAKSTKFEIYKDGKGEFRWRLVSRNGESVAVGGEGYESRRGAVSAAKKLKDWADTEAIVDVEK